MVTKKASIEKEYTLYQLYSKTKILYELSMNIEDDIKIQAIQSHNVLLHNFKTMYYSVAYSKLK